MKPELALAKSADRNTVFLDVGDEQDVLVRLLGALIFFASCVFARLRSPKWPK
jgi:hypothetical protein